MVTSFPITHVSQKRRPGSAVVPYLQVVSSLIFWVFFVVHFRILSFYGFVSLAGDTHTNTDSLNL